MGFRSTLVLLECTICRLNFVRKNRGPVNFWEGGAVTFQICWPPGTVAIEGCRDLIKNLLLVVLLVVVEPECGPFTLGRICIAKFTSRLF